MSENTKTETTQKKRGHFSRNWFFYLIMVLLAATSGYFWLTKQQALATMQNIHNFEQEELVLKAQNELNLARKEGITSTAKSLSWAVTQKALEDDMDGIDVLFRDLVKSSNISEIDYLQDDGIVLVSTNKKKEEDFYPHPDLAQILKTEDIQYFSDENGEKLVVAPVRNQENDLGLLIISYKKKVFK